MAAFQSPFRLDGIRRKAKGVTIIVSKEVGISDLETYIKMNEKSLADSESNFMILSEDEFKIDGQHHAAKTF